MRIEDTEYGKDSGWVWTKFLKYGLPSAGPIQAEKDAVLQFHRPPSINKAVMPYSVSFGLVDVIEGM